MNDLHFFFLAVSSLAIGLTLLYFTFKRFEIAVFLVAFSVWVPHIFFKNTRESILLQQEETGISSYIRIIIILAMGLIGLIKFLQYLPRFKRKIPLQFIILGLFLLFALISISYSLDPNITFIRAVTFLGVVLFLLGLYAWIKEEEHLYKILNTLYFLVFVFIILNILYVILMPGRAWWYAANRFIGIWSHPNTAGIFCLTSYPILIWKFKESNSYNKILISCLFIFVVSMHVLTGSRTSLFASAIGICTWFIIQGKALKIVVSLGVIALALFVLIQVKPESLERDQSKGLTDVTGRDDLWKNAFALIEEKPLTGYGYSVRGEVWNDPRFYKKGYKLYSGSNRASLHNGYLSTAVGLGLSGLLIWIIVLLIPFFKALGGNDTTYRNYKSFAISIMVMMILVDFAESSLDSTASIGAIFFWISWTIAGKLNSLEKESILIQDEKEIAEVHEESFAA